MGMGGGGAGAGGGAASQGNLLDWADKLYGQGLTAVTKGVKSLLAGGRMLGVARATEALLDGRPGTEADDFLCLDPRLPRGASASAVPMGGQGGGAGGAGGQAQPRRDAAIVFMLGAGSFLEHRALQEAAARAPPGAPRTIAYGATEFASGAELLAQLAELSRGGGGGGGGGMM